jgi:hypothetical protein
MTIDRMEITLEISPRVRFDVVDVRRRVLEMHGAMSVQYPRALYCSYHTTAGYLDQSLVSRLNMARDGVTPYLRAFQTVFPEVQMSSGIRSASWPNSTAGYWVTA